MLGASVLGGCSVPFGPAVEMLTLIPWTGAAFFHSPKKLLMLTFVLGVFFRALFRFSGFRGLGQKGQRNP